MPPKSVSTSTGYQFCDRCNQLLHRSVVWRHKRLVTQAEALAASVPIPAETQVPEPPPSSPLIGSESNMSMSQVLSDLHLSEILEDGFNPADFGIAQAPVQPDPQPAPDGMHMEGVEDGLERGQQAGGSQEEDNGLGGGEAGGSGAQAEDELMVGPMTDALDNDWDAVALLAWQGGHREASEPAEDGFPSNPAIAPGNPLGALDDALSLNSWTETPSIPSIAAPPSPIMSSLPELALIWDLEAARNRTSPLAHSTSWR